MVDDQIRARGIDDARTLAAMRAVPRHAFVAPLHQAAAYDDHPLPTGHGQTISQPYMVAAMTAALGLSPGDHVLEVGTGSGYQTAILSHLAADVLSFEWVPELAARARTVLASVGVANVMVTSGDGSRAHPGRSFDAVLVAAGAPRVPPALPSALADGGRLVMPIGTPDRQELLVVRRRGARFVEERRGGCVFVPLLGPHGWRPARMERKVDA